MIVAEVSRHECLKLGEPEVERNPNLLRQTVDSRVLTSSACSHSAREQASPKGRLADVVSRELCSRVSKETAFAVKSTNL